ncbi:MAG TPA: MFS transporter, partial [bacterium]
MDDPQGHHAASTPVDDPRHAHWRRNLYALSSGIFLSTLGFTMSWPFLPLIVRELGVTTHLETWVGFLVGSFFVTSFVLTPVWGGLADHFGKRSMVLRAGFGMSTGFLLLPFMPGVAWFLPIFLLIGVANGYTPAAFALIASNTPNPHMGRSLATAQMAAMLGNTLGPAAGSALVLVLPRYIDLFWASAALILCGGFIALAFVREPPSQPAGQYRLTVLEDFRTCLRIPVLPPLLFSTIIFAMSFFGSTTVVSLYTMDLMHGSTSHLGIAVGAWVGLATVSLTVASSLAVPLWGRLVDRYSPADVLGVALALGVAASLIFPIVADPLQLTAARFVLGALAIGTQPAMLRLMKAAAPPGMDARVLAFGTAGSMLGNGGAPMLAGAMAPWVGLRAYFLVVALLLLASLGWWWWRGMRPSGK